MTKPTLFTGLSLITMVVGTVLLGTRWVTKIGPEPIYMVNILLLGAMVASLKSLQALKHSGLTLFPLLLFLLWTFARAVPPVPLTTDFIRYIAPFAYSVLAVITYALFRRADARQVSLGNTIVLAALVIHGTWAVPSALFFPSGIELLSPPGIDNQILSYRSDIDGALLGVLLSFLVLRFLNDTVRGANKIWFPIAISVLSFTILASGKRAAILATGVMLGYVLFTIWRSYRAKRLLHQPAGMISLVIGALAGWAFEFWRKAQEVATLKSLNLFDVYGVPAELIADFRLGTVIGRLNGWQVLGNWLLESPERILFGVGFRTNFMLDSGSVIALTNTADATADPHNFILTVLARLGIIGVLLFSAVVVLALVRLFSTQPSSHNEMVPNLIFLGLITVSLFGVVWESPFGSIPFWWCLGLLLSRDKLENKYRNGLQRGAGR